MTLAFRVPQSSSSSSVGTSTTARGWILLTQMSWTVPMQTLTLTCLLVTQRLPARTLRKPPHSVNPRAALTGGIRRMQERVTSTSPAQIAAHIMWARGKALRLSATQRLTHASRTPSSALLGCTTSPASWTLTHLSAAQPCPLSPADSPPSPPSPPARRHCCSLHWPTWPLLTWQ